MAEHMLTTYDNPWNPYTHYAEWDAFDQHMGYHTSSLLARLVVDSTDLPETVRSQAIEDAIDMIIADPVLSQTWRRVSPNQELTSIKLNSG